MTNYEDIYIKETGDKKPRHNNYNVTEHHLSVQWYQRFSDWLTQQLERVEGENKNIVSISHYPDTEADGIVFCGKCGKQK